jgi:3-(3-hydroxy-phenyl)propionate hydroxylase
LRAAEVIGRRGFTNLVWKLACAGHRVNTITIAPDDVSRGHCDQAPARELNGVVAGWFDAHGCRAAVVRPDHYVCGVAGDSASLSELTHKLPKHLHSYSHSRHTRTHDGG